MYKCKVYCEADVYLRIPFDDSTENNPNELIVRTIYSHSTITTNITSVTRVSFDRHHLTLACKATILAEALVKYDPYINHINDYKIRGCSTLRRDLSEAGLSVGAVLAPSIETYNSPRVAGFKQSKQSHI